MPPFNPYGFEADVKLTEHGSTHLLHIKTQNTNGRPYFVAITRLAVEAKPG